MKVKKTAKVAHETGCCCWRLARKEEARKPSGNDVPGEEQEARAHG